MYQGEGPSAVVALPAGTYKIETHCDDGEADLRRHDTGQLWDTTVHYPYAGEWTRDGEPVLYEELSDGDVATLVRDVFMTADHASLPG
jgi:hypothetical protein